MSDASEKKLYIIAGPNGAGKTTFALEYLPKVAGCTYFIYQLLLEEAKR